jgi:hypothetical protein|tara:strand:+ start:1076 stop:1204 length:129 start_codon:yes stop_codon:yes gene_type:complete
MWFEDMDAETIAMEDVVFEDISEEEQQAELDEENFMEMDDGA